MTLITWDDIQEEKRIEKAEHFKMYDEAIKRREITWDKTALAMHKADDIGGEGERYVRLLLRSLGHKVGGKSPDRDWDFSMWVKGSKGEERVKCEVKTSQWYYTTQQGTQLRDRYKYKGTCQFCSIKPAKFDYIFFNFVQPTGIKTYFAKSSLVDNDYHLKKIQINWQNELHQEIEWPKGLSAKEEKSGAFGNACDFLLHKRLNNTVDHRKKQINKITKHWNNFKVCA